MMLFVGAPLQKTAMICVSDLKAGLSNRVVGANNPVTFTDPTGLETYIYTNNGVSVVNSGQGFLNTVNAVAPHSITAIVTRGHGGTHVADFTSAKGQHGNFAAVAKGTVLQLPSGPRKFIPLKEILKDKLAKGAGIYLNNCSTATEDDNLAISLSKDFPDAIVRGVDGTLEEGTVLGTFKDSGTFRYFQNGEQVHPIRGGAQPDYSGFSLGGYAHPYTNFSQDSQSR